MEESMLNVIADIKTSVVQIMRFVRKKPENTPDNAAYYHISFLHKVVRFSKIHASMLCLYPFPKQQISDSSKLKEVCRWQFKFVEKGRPFFEWVENTVGKEEIAHYEQFLLFPQRFQNTCIADR